MARDFKFYPEDFPELPVKVRHMDLVIDVYDDHTNITCDQLFIAEKDLNSVALDARKLEVKTVECEREIEYNYDEKKAKLNVTFKEPVKKGEKVTLHTKTTCKPTANDLEGLYYDETPKGAPPQQITQCQQWGFQKLVPSFDYMNTKCTYKTKIIADSRYTHLITNGDIVEKRKDLGNGRSEIVYDNSITPMAPYLFFLGVGTWESFEQEFEYPDGKTFALELLTLPGTDKVAAQDGMEILSYGVMWTYVFTGPKTYKDIETKNKLFDLMQKRDMVKIGKEKGDLEQLRSEIKALADGLIFGYRYTGTVYREIAMQNSNFGGMENVGNTTIASNRLLPSKDVSDGVFGYIMEVKTHEFYHNLNGSEVTSWSPFELWLNEANNQIISDQQFSAFAAGEDYARLGNVLRIISTHGTFNEDTGAMGMPIIPEGFNNPDELITSVTYSKAPEFVRMVMLLMGKEKFMQALHNYHTRFSHSNAKTEDWLEEMEKESGLDLKRMSDVWLRQIGYPTVEVETNYNAEEKKCTLKLKQTGFKEGKHWEFPFTYALLDSEGNKLNEGMLHFKNIEEEIVVEAVDEPAIYSFNRGFSFYGKVKLDRSEDSLYLQVEKDDDVVSRYLAFYDIADKEKIRLIDNPSSEPNERFVDMIYSLLSDNELCDSIGTSLLAITDSVEDEYKAHMYEELYQARKKIRNAIANKYEKELKEIYESRTDRKIDAPYVEEQFFNIKNREVKNACLGILSEIDTPEIHKLIKEQWETGTCTTDRLTAFSLYISSSADDRLDLIDEFEKEAVGNLVKWEQFLSLIASNDAKDTLELVKKYKKSPNFRITQSNDQRALLMRFSMNRRLSLIRKDGQEFLKECLMELAPINEYNTAHLLDSFSKLNYMQEEYLPDLLEILLELFDSLDEEKSPSVYNTVRRLIKSAPRAIEAYEKVKGKLDPKYLE